MLSYHKRYMVISLFYTLLTPLFLPLFQKTLCQHNCSLDQKIGQCPATMTPFPIAIMTFTMALRLPAPMLRTTTTPPAVANNKKIIRYHGSFALVMLGQFMETCEKTQGKYKCLTQNKIAYYCFTLSPGRPTRSITHSTGPYESYRAASVPPNHAPIAALWEQLLSPRAWPTRKRTATSPGPLFWSMAALSARCCESNRRQGMCKETRRSAGVPPSPGVDDFAHALNRRASPIRAGSNIIGSIYP